jgi:hypothetical protein
MSITTTERVMRTDAGFDPIPSRRSAATIQVADTVPRAATIVGIPVFFVVAVFVVPILWPF